MNTRENPLTGWPEKLGNDELEYDDEYKRLRREVFKRERIMGSTTDRKSNQKNIGAKTAPRQLNIINVQKCKNKIGNNNKTTIHSQKKQQANANYYNTKQWREYLAK